MKATEEQKKRMMEAYRKRYANPEYRRKVLDQNIAWAKAHPENGRKRALAHRNRDVKKARSRHKAWSKSPEGRAWYRTRDANRRAAKKASPEELKLIREFTMKVRSMKQSTCYYCGSKNPGTLMHIDHIIPITKGGPHRVDNLCAACQHCNQTKINKLLADWIRVGQQILDL